jgi:putative DNA modification/repair radical SAM protein
MELMEKLRILSGAAKYDASCASSGSRRETPAGGIGNASTASAGICHSWSDDGRCVSLLKILMTNFCIHDCAYCLNRRSNDVPRAGFSVNEVVRLTIDFYKRNYIEGLFLSSGIFRDADFTMEAILRVVKRLRIEERFGGYIHVKAIPGASERLIRETGLFADRMSVNVELPSERSLKLLAPQKSGGEILRAMNTIAGGILEDREDHGKSPRAKRRYFVPAGQSTQLIVGATPDSDWDVLSLTGSLYGVQKLKRVYYSAYVPVNHGGNLPALDKPPLLREHRLYQADWLLRFYRFSVDEILGPDKPWLDESVDPKTGWALRHLDFFPVEINTADYETLLRVPGLGVLSAQRILTARKTAALEFEHLKKMGVVMKRAKHFLTCGGKRASGSILDAESLPERLMIPDAKVPEEVAGLFG